MRTLLRGGKVSPGLICESQARSLVRRNISLLAPGRKGKWADPDPGDTEAGFLKLPLNPFGTLKPRVVSRRQQVGVAE